MLKFSTVTPHECQNPSSEKCAVNAAGATISRPQVDGSRLSPTTADDIFHAYCGPDPQFIDRFERQRADGVDVIIPVLHTNALWRKNLLSYYREIPIHRLLVGDAGADATTLAVVREFPRVVILDHRDYVSLGYSIRKLIEAVETEWFVYLHSDVFLPAGWYDAMTAARSHLDWFECPQQLTICVETSVDLPAWRAFSGSQMGRTEALRKVLPKIDDDYLYRNEDIVIAELVKNGGYSYGRVTETFHFHQLMPKKSRWKRDISLLPIQVSRSREEEIREYSMQARGIVKYLDPSPELVDHVRDCLYRLIRLGVTNYRSFFAWAETVNPKWPPYLRTLATAAQVQQVATDFAAIWQSLGRFCRSLASLSYRILLPRLPSRKRRR